MNRKNHGLILRYPHVRYVANFPTRVSSSSTLSPTSPETPASPGVRWAPKRDLAPPGRRQQLGGDAQRPARRLGLGQRGGMSHPPPPARAAPPWGTHRDRAPSAGRRPVARPGSAAPGSAGHPPPAPGMGERAYVTVADEQRKDWSCFTWWLRGSGGDVQSSLIGS